MLWVPSTTADVGSAGEGTLLCCTEDGWLLRLSARGKRLASMRLEVSGQAVPPARPVAGARALPGPVPSAAQAHVRCLQADNQLVDGGCSDGSIRCWLLAEEGIEEVYRHTAAHVGPINSISISEARTDADAESSGATTPVRSFAALRHTQMLITAGDDCSVKVWRVYCSGDY
jgi:hypothetical protein